MNLSRTRPSLAVRRGECLVVVTNRDGSCEIHPVKRNVDDGPTPIRDGLAVVLDKRDAYESARFGTFFFVSAEEGRSVRYKGSDGWDGPSGSRVGRAMMDVRAKDVARVEPEGLFGFLTKAMPLMMLLVLLMMGYLVVHAVVSV